jgi:hypothetical protein
MTTIYIKTFDANEVGDLLGKIISFKEYSDKEIRIKFEDPEVFADACGYRFSIREGIDPDTQYLDAYSLEDFLGYYASHFACEAVYSIPDTLELVLELENPFLINLFPTEQHFQQLLDANN